MSFTAVRVLSSAAFTARLLEEYDPFGLGLSLLDRLLSNDSCPLRNESVL